MLSDEFRKKEEKFVEETKKNSQDVYDEIIKDLIAHYNHSTMGCKRVTELFVYRAEFVKDDGMRMLGDDRAIHLPTLIELLNVERLKDPHLEWAISDLLESGIQWLTVTASLAKKRERLDEFFEYDLETQKMAPARYDEETNSFVRIDPVVPILKP